MSSEDDKKEAHLLLDEWGKAYERLEGAGYPSGQDPPGDGFSDRTFATTARLNHLLAVNAAISKTPREQQLALYYVYVCGKSYSATGELLGLPKTTCADLTNRALKNTLYHYRMGLYLKGRRKNPPKEKGG